VGRKVKRVKGNPPKLEINSDLYEAGLNFVKAASEWVTS
jgi:hypothetical protein